MGRRILAFFLGMIFGIILVFASVIGAVYFALTTVTPDTIYPESEKFLGDFANMTLYDIYNELSKLYGEKLGIPDENGRYYTLGEFLEQYHIDPVQAFGKELPPDILEIPILEFFGGSSENSMNQIRASVIFSFINMLTQTTDEEGNVTGGYFSESTIAKLYLHTMAELTDPEKGISYVFADLLLVDLLSTAFPADEPTEGDKLMWAVGQSSVGKLLGGFGQNVMLQFKEDGAFEALGALTVKELIGSASMYIELIFGKEKFADLIDDNGNLDIDGIMNDMYLGRLLSYTREEIVDTVGYEELVSTDEKTVLIKHTQENIDYAIIANNRLYYAQISCGQEEHTHSADCFDFIWYNCHPSSGHEHNEDCFVTGNIVGGMMGKLSNEKIKNLTSISDALKNFTLKDVFGNDVPKYLKAIENTPIGELNSAINGMYLGDFLGYKLKDGDSDLIWYTATLNSDKCTNTSPDHTHTDDCYDFAKVEGIMGKIASQKISDLGDLGSTIQTFTLKDVLGDNVPAPLKSIENTAIGEIGSAIDNMYLGEFLGYVKMDDDKWYSKTLTNNTEICPGPDHEHKEECYDYTEISGLVGRISGLKITELNEKNIMDQVNDTPLGEVLNMDNANGLLKELADVKIGELSSELDALYVGIAMGYHREETNYTGNLQDEDLEDTYHKNGNKIVFDSDSKPYFFDAKHNRYYEAQLTCTENTNNGHVHAFNCYGFVWYKCLPSTGDTTTHSHTDECVVKGLNGKMSNLRIDELGSENGMTKIAQSLTIGDLIDSGMMELSLEDEYKLAIIFDGCSNSDCSLGNYLTKKAAENLNNRDLTAKQFYESMEHNGGDKDAWRQMRLSDFISTLLGSL